MSSEPTNLARLSMSLPAELFRQLDMMVEERGLPSRSQLIAELIRHALAEHEARVRPDDMLAGTVTLVCQVPGATSTTSQRAAWDTASCTEPKSSGTRQVSALTRPGQARMATRAIRAHRPR